MRIPLPPEFLSRPLTHRGYHDRARGIIENSASAVSAAVAAGYGIEIDLQLSSDGVPMVFHDETLDRLTDKAGDLNAHTAAELQQLPLKGCTDTIPTLAQILTLIGGAVPLLIEIKDQSLTLGQTDGRLEAAVAQVLAAYPGPVALMSFNPHSVALMATLAPTLPRGLTTSSYDLIDWHPVPKATCDTLRDIPDYDRTESSFISHEASDLSRARVTALRAQGAAILCWTIRSAQAEAEARKIAQNITFEGYAA
jgi:glycerophosphoryl diester phosphodiesterase